MRHFKSFIIVIGFVVMALTAAANVNAQIGPCKTDSSHLCLLDGTYAVEVEWRDFAGNTGSGKTAVLPDPITNHPMSHDATHDQLWMKTQDSGIFWFFSPSNLELLVKVLDGCSVNQHVWVSFAATTNVEFKVRVRNTITGEVREYLSSAGQLAANKIDTEAFSGPRVCPALDSSDDEPVAKSAENPQCTLKANPTLVTEGGQVKLGWTTTNAKTVSLEPGVGLVHKNGYVTVTPTATTTYTLTAEGGEGTTPAVCTVTARVVPPGTNPACTLTASASQIVAGQPVTLSWSTSSSASATLRPDVGVVALDGSMTLDPTATTTYRLTAKGAPDTDPAICTAKVHVVPPSPAPTCSLTARVNAGLGGLLDGNFLVTQGELFELEWTSQNADSVSLQPGVGSVELNGSLTVVAASLGVTAYELHAASVSGEVTICPIDVEVILPLGIDINVATTTIRVGTLLSLGSHVVNAAGSGSVSWSVRGPGGQLLGIFNNLPVLNYLFALVGDYQVTSTVTDALGRTASDTVNIRVNLL